MAENWLKNIFRNMRSLGLVLVLAIATSAFPAGNPAEDADSISFRCSINKDYDVPVKNQKAQLYLCSSEEGPHFLFAPKPSDNYGDEFNVAMSKKGVFELKNLGAVFAGAPAERPKRSPDVGVSGSGAAAAAHAASGATEIRGPLGLGISASGSSSHSASIAGALGGIVTNPLGVLG